jgi:putative addiction module killer protein
MSKIEQTDLFAKWLFKLKDLKGRVAIARRIERMEQGNFGDMKSLGENFSELRITTGPGYRIYFIQKEERIIILLAGGDKSTQSKDIAKAKTMLKEYEDE